MQRRQSLAQTPLTARSGGHGFDPLEGEKGGAFGLTAADHPRDPQRPRTRQLGESCGFGFKHRTPGARGDLDEQQTRAASPGVALVDAATGHGAFRRGRTLSHAQRAEFPCDA